MTGSMPAVATPGSAQGSRVSISRRDRLKKSHGAPYAPSDNPRKLYGLALKPESQIEPWLAHRPHALLVGVSERRGSSTQGNMDRNLTSFVARQMHCKQRGSWRKGLNVETSLTPPSQGKKCLLTFPFIEPGKREEQLLAAVGSRAASAERAHQDEKDRPSNPVPAFTSGAGLLNTSVQRGRATGRDAGRRRRPSRSAVPWSGWLFRARSG
jgi:hypothetical protein